MKKNIIVAVIDRGLDTKHKDINIYRNTVECTSDGQIDPSKDVEDKDGNGFPGDCMGWNFTNEFQVRTRRDRGNPNATQAGDARRFEIQNERNQEHNPLQGRLFGSQRIEDDRGHGTHVAGLIAAIRDNKIGITSLSNKIFVLPLKVNRKLSEKKSKFLNAARIKEATTSDLLTQGEAKLLKEYSLEESAKRIIRAIEYATLLKKEDGSKVVDVINLSMSWPSHAVSEETRISLRTAVKLAVESKIVIVVAAGNNRTILKLEPCDLKGVICVGATNNSDHYSGFTNYGGQVNLMAPGEMILSLFPNSKSLYGEQLLSDQGVDIMSGTSQSAPIVAMMAAVIKGVMYDDTNKIDLTNDQVYAQLVKKTSKVKRKKPKVDFFYAQNGRVSLKDAFTPVAQSVVEPIFKELSNIKITPESSQTGSFNLPIPIKNFGTNTRSVFVKLSSTAKHVQVRNSEYTLNQNELEKLNSAEELVIDFDIFINNTNKHRIIPIYVEITTDTKSKIFKHEIEPYFQIEDSHAKTYNFNIPENVLKDFNSYNFKRPGGKTILQTVNFTDKKSDFPEFFSVVYKPESRLHRGDVPLPYDDAKLYVYNHSENNLKVKKELVFKDALKSAQFTIWKTHLNSDNKLDYFISYIKFHFNEDGFPESLSLNFNYFDHNLNYLTGPLQSVNVNKIKYLGKDQSMRVFLESFNLQFMPYVYKNHTVKIPYFFQKHLMPDSDNRIPLSHAEILKQKKSILYFTPIEKENEISFDLNYLFNQDFDKYIKLKLNKELNKFNRLKRSNKKAHHSQQVIPIQLLDRTVEDISKNQFKMLFQVTHFNSDLQYRCKETSDHLIFTFNKNSFDSNKYSSKKNFAKVKYISPVIKRSAPSMKCQNLRSTISLNNNTNNGLYYFPQIHPRHIKAENIYLNKDLSGYDHLMKTNTSDVTEFYLNKLDAQEFYNNEGTEVQKFESQAHDLGSFIKDDHQGRSHYQFTQSFSEVSIAKDINGAEVSRISKPINLYSYKVLSIVKLQTFRAIKYKKENSNWPALLVNNKSMKAGHFFVWTYNDKDLISPLNLNINAPANCITMNPEITDSNGTQSLILMCKKDQAWNLKVLDIRSH